MSLKENLDYVKTELSTQEKFIENFIKAEKIYKKYKGIIIGVGVAAVVIVVALVGLNYIEDQNRLKANVAFNKFLADKNDLQSLEVLKSNNKNLYEIALHLKDANHIPDVPLFKEIAQFQDALKNNNMDVVNSLLNNNNFLLKEYAIALKVLMDLKSDNVETAKQTLQMLPQDGTSGNLVELLEHYISTK
ncbi:hypothetical protein [Arcobacter sp. FWKO B]|uniref:hypothetical protein n=1 Tax=Arcobacter sp. FWKO B TaxID=2593672 RepID=UPI0018A5168D|nr:hypothetical protein [Arcobacter sp. FWKO B]QOG12904.1 hypothetical protein FWKOB_09450 [Arcobacter sp. FWKO B]